ncbi:MAG: PLP-dependent aminotransferase family protein [Oscillospiraceae bacterium]|nr:PLP-dependent aminotransferase family protein [Oscillospiraceae bacterium]
MEFYISRKMKDMKPSAIREFFKYASVPGVISYSAGSPSPEALPVEAIREITSRIVEEDVEKALLYSVSEGYTPLREELRKYVADNYSSTTDDDDILILSGATQSVDLAAKVLCDEGDTVICEDPSFTGCLNTFRTYGVNLAGVPVSETGIDLNRLERALKEEKRVRLIYTIPNFQNPTGYTMDLPTRRGLYELAVRYNVPILEDDPYGDLRFEGEALPTIKSMDKEGLVLYNRTFSKVLSAGIRVGYFIVPKALMGMLTVGKQSTDVHTGMISQLLCYRFLAGYDLTAHIKAIAPVYKRKCGLMLSELGRLPGDKITFSRPEGGLFVWATLPGITDASEFVMRLVMEKKVATVPGGGFFARQPHVSNCLRMTFAAPSDEQIVTGIGLMGELLKEY